MRHASVNWSVAQVKNAYNVPQFCWFFLLHFCHHSFVCGIVAPREIAPLDAFESLSVNPKKVSFQITNPEKVLTKQKQTVNNLFLVAFFTRTCHVILMKTIAFDKQTVNNLFLVPFFTHTCHDILMKTIAYDKQTVNNLFLVAFFTHTCHVILMKTKAYVTVTLNKNITDRHPNPLFSVYNYITECRRPLLLWKTMNQTIRDVQWCFYSR